MKIAVWYNFPSGGAKRALWYQVKGLVERGHHVEIWRPALEDASFLPLEEFCREHIVPLHQPLPPSESQSNNPMQRALQEYRSESKYRAAFFEHCRLCANEIMQSKFDVVFTASSVHFGTNPIGRFVSIPSLIYLQEPRRVLYEARPRSPWEAESFTAPFWSPGHVPQRIGKHIRMQIMREAVRDERENAAAFKRILVNSKYSRESVLRAYGLESSVCYLGVDTQMFHPADGAKKPFVIGLGELSPHKGISRAFKALATIPRERRPKFVWVGNRTNRQRQMHAESLARMLDVDFSLRVAIPDKELIELLSSATVMLYTPMLEPFGFAPLEAAACETPVVAIAEGGVRETVVDGVTGYLLPDATPNALGDAIMRLLHDPSLARNMGVRARDNVLNKWTWSRAIDDLERHLIAVGRAGRSSGAVNAAGDFQHKTSV